ncbi:hypothetical protein HRG_007817 [Hirsutella rhossiliensis]|uniref:Uncharacterized protein n=1 Tax=Hirsutella rhossiliensis TaxID=111463 RepID=A0A9P8SG17_9HYPO|nr:uncharacterized protein HRG_07817 [Hirsutella rhossiliensis]KAH0960664.1 hypothetical protein HRG_07817 [Hirsutella rhossiliensis]
MGDPEDTQDGQPAEPHPASTGNGVDKAKGKDQANKASVAERLQASGKMAFNAVAGASTIPDAVPGQKAPAGPSTSSRLPTMLGEASSSQLTARVGEPLRLNQNGQGSSEAFNSFINEQPRQDTISSLRHGSQNHTSFTEQEATDGAAVVRLLSLPDDPVDELPIEDGDCLSPDEAARLREALFGVGNADSSKPRWDDMLSLVPDSISHPSAASSAAARLHVGTADPVVAQSIWLQQWSDVLSSYTDEVWGDLGPLAAEAKHDVERQMQGKQPVGLESSETKALRRLRLILAHVHRRI